jgi:hypothetical protein
MAETLMQKRAIYTIQQILVKIVSYNFWKCHTTNTGLILSVEIMLHDTICRIV